MTETEQEKIEGYSKRREDILRILDEIVEIIKFQDRPEDTIIEQKLEEIKKNIKSIIFEVRYEKNG